jgi:hypothetical protein
MFFFCCSSLGTVVQEAFLADAIDTANLPLLAYIAATILKKFRACPEFAILFERAVCSKLISDFPPED